MLVTLIATFVDLFVTVFNFLIIVRIITGLVAKDGNRFYQGLVNITEPILAPLRRILPKSNVFDFSPTAAILLLYLLDSIVNAWANSFQV